MRRVRIKADAARQVKDMAATGGPSTSAGNKSATLPRGWKANNRKDTVQELVTSEEKRKELEKFLAKSLNSDIVKKMLEKAATSETAADLSADRYPFQIYKGIFSLPKGWEEDLCENSELIGISLNLAQLQIGTAIDANNIDGMESINGTKDTVKTKEMQKLLEFMHALTEPNFDFFSRSKWGRHQYEKLYACVRETLIKRVLNQRYSDIWPFIQKNKILYDKKAIGEYIVNDILTEGVYSQRERISIADELTKLVHELITKLLAEKKKVDPNYLATDIREYLHNPATLYTEIKGTTTRTREVEVTTKGRGGRSIVKTEQRTEEGPVQYKLPQHMQYVTEAEREALKELFTNVSNMKDWYMKITVPSPPSVGFFSALREDLVAINTLQKEIQTFWRKSFGDRSPAWKHYVTQSGTSITFQKLSLKALIRWATCEGRNDMPRWGLISPVFTSDLKLWPELNFNFYEAASGSARPHTDSLKEIFQDREDVQRYFPLCYEYILATEEIYEEIRGSPLGDGLRYLGELKPRPDGNLLEEEGSIRSENPE
jgi:hypothetical protein